MRKLASNEVAALYLCGNEYWIVRYRRDMVDNDKTWETICVNSRERDEKTEALTYWAIHAFAYFEGRYGAATWKHDRLASY